MVTTTLTATIFVSSPGDVQQERNSINTTVAKWNSRNSNARGVTFHVWAWEDNSVPDIGSDAQDVMNEQIPADYDIIIGIFWSRLGTPTERSGSGSQEEIELAIERREQNGSPHVAIYFKKDNFPIDDVDIQQLERLRSFENDIKSRALISQFTEIQSFESQIERLLDKKAEEFRSGFQPSKSKPTTQAITKCEASESKSKYEDYGLLDLIEESEVALGTSTKLMNEIANRVSSFGNTLENVSGRIKSAQEYGDVSIKKTRPIIREASDEMNLLSSFIDERIEEFSQNFVSSAEMAVHVVDVSHDFNDSESVVLEFKTSLHDMINGGKEAIVSQNELRDTVMSLPRLDIKTNQAKRRLSGAIDRLTDVMQAGLDRLSDI